MQNLQEAHTVLVQKKKERREINKMFQDELKHHGDYQKILEDMKVLRERKKSIENQIKASALANANQMDVLALEIKDQNQMLADIALNMYVANETVEVIDEENARWLPEFSVRFKKEEGESMVSQIREATHEVADKDTARAEKELQPA